MPRRCPGASATRKTKQAVGKQLEQPGTCNNITESPAAALLKQRGTCEKIAESLAAATVRQPGARGTESLAAMVTKAAKKTVRDVLVWRIFGELSGKDHRAGFRQVLKRWQFTMQTESQLINAYDRTCQTLGSQLQAQCAETDSMPNGLIDDIERREPEKVVPLFLPIRAPPGLEMFL